MEQGKEPTSILSHVTQRLFSIVRHRPSQEPIGKFQPDRFVICMRRLLFFLSIQCPRPHSPRRTSSIIHLSSESVRCNRSALACFRRRKDSDAQVSKVVTGRDWVGCEFRLAGSNVGKCGEECIEVAYATGSVRNSPRQIWKN